MDGGKRFSARVGAGSDPAAAIVTALRVAEEFAAGARIDEGLSAKLLVVIEELVANVVRHGSKEGNVELWLELREWGGGVEIELEDTGAAFDPSAPRAFHGPDGVSGGGVGLELVRTWAAEMTYARENERNRLRLVLR